MLKKKLKNPYVGAAVVAVVAGLAYFLDLDPSDVIDTLFNGE
jgi:hypothetical protein